MIYLIKRFFTPTKETYYYLYYKGKSYIIRINKGMDLHIDTLYLVKDVEKTIYEHMIKYNLTAMTNKNEFFEHTLNVIGDDD